MDTQVMLYVFRIFTVLIICEICTFEAKVKHFGLNARKPVFGGL